MQHTYKNRTWQLFKVFIATTLLVVLSVICTPTKVLAWKPTTHVYLGEQALNDALDDGKVTISKVDDKTGSIISTVGNYQVDSNILTALRNNPAQYRAGILGPDAYPDIVTGQQVIHPGEEDTGISGGSDAWLQHLWEQSNAALSPPVTAFTIGFLTHAAGDMYGHTFINHFSGGPFAIQPPRGPSNAIKHIVLEGYIDKRLDTEALQGNFFNASISGIEDFIYQQMVNAAPGTELDRQLLIDGGGGTDFSIPRIYSTLRANLQRDISTYYAKKDDLKQRAEACKTFDFSCSKIALYAERTTYIAANGPIITYKEAWRDDIDQGLKAWPQVSHRVAQSLFFNSSRNADTQKAESILQEYATDHLLSMSGAPDFIGLSIGAIGDVIDTITPDIFLKPIRQLKEDMLNSMLQASIGMTKQDLSNYLIHPDQYFDQVMTRGAGQEVSLQQFNSDYLKIRDTGFNNPSESFDYRNVPATYNTVVMSKLIMLNQSEVNRLIRDLGSSESPEQSNIMLGFVPTLDGSNQWTNGMVLRKNCNVYSQIFMKQAGEEDSCTPTID